MFWRGEAAKVHRWLKDPEKRGYKWGLGGGEVGDG